MLRFTNFKYIKTSYNIFRRYNVRSTSKFTSSQMDRYNIKFEPTKFIGDICDIKKSLDINHVLMLKDVNNDNINKVDINTLENNKQKTLLFLIRAIIKNESVSVGTSESNTSNMVDFILRNLDMDNYPLILRLKPVYNFLVGNKKITSIPDFSIEKNSKVIFIDEDKHLSNAKRISNWGEYQIAGEMIAASNYTLNNTKIDTNTLYSVRVIGTRFTFYKSQIGIKYLESLISENVEESIYIKRYKGENIDDSNLGLDFVDLNQRYEILNLLYNIKESFD